MTVIVPDGKDCSRPETSDSISPVIAAVVCHLKSLQILSQMILMVLVVRNHQMPIILLLLPLCVVRIHDTQESERGSSHLIRFVNFSLVFLCVHPELYCRNWYLCLSSWTIRCHFYCCCSRRVPSEVITDIVPDDTGASRRPETSNASSTVIAAVVCRLKPWPILSHMILMVLVLKHLIPFLR